MNTNDRETPTDHLSILKGHVLMRYQRQQHYLDQLCPYNNSLILSRIVVERIFFAVEMQRIRKDSETSSNFGSSTASRIHLENE